MSALLAAAVEIVVLASILRYALGKFEPGRTFEMQRVLLAAAVVVAVYAIPAMADYLYHWRAAVYPRFPLLRTFWGSVASWFAAFPILFFIQWVAYRTFLKDVSGAPLSRRGNLWLAALPTLIWFLLIMSAMILMGAVFYAIGSK